MITEAQKRRWDHHSLNMRHETFEEEVAEAESNGYRVLGDKETIPQEAFVMRAGGIDPFLGSRGVCSLAYRYPIYVGAAQHVCRECAHWERDDTLTSNASFEIGLCGSDTVGESEHQNGVQEYDEGGYTGQLKTGPLFGCIHWKKRAPLTRSPEDREILLKCGTTITLKDTKGPPYESMGAALTRSPE